ncbi:MAG: zinc metalloprotease HtpX [Myxococcaceae bacterium]|nr:zinc metalloprotease HtpX [Myxococcaceae bacterium]
MWNQLKTALLLGTLTVLLIALGGALGQGYLYGFTAFALLLNFVMYFFSDKLVLAMHRAQPLSERDAPWLHAMVAEIAQSAGLPKPRVYLVPQAQPNAFATGRSPKHAIVAVTSGLLELLDGRELRGVLAHEIGHIKNRDMFVATVAAGIAGAITYLAHALQWGAMFGGGAHDDDDGGRGNVFGALAMAFIAPFAAMLIQLAISRSREHGADATGAALTGDPEGLARALEKLHVGAERIPANVEPATASLFIVNPLSGQGGLMSWFSTHPPPEERIRRLRQMSPHGHRRLQQA